MNTAKQRKQQTRLIGISLFICLVLVGGLILRATGNTDDPFVNMSDIVDMRQMLADTEQSGELAPANAGTEVDAALPAAAATHANTITWSAWGEVLYDLWFLCATTAVFIVFSYLISWFVGLLTHKRPLPPVNQSPRSRQVPPGQQK